MEEKTETSEKFREEDRIQKNDALFFERILNRGCYSETGFQIGMGRNFVCLIDLSLSG
jgi:hypothetical protein